MINKIRIEDKDRYYELGLLINNKFEKLYDLDKILDSSYDSVFGYYEEDKLIGFIHINKIYENIDIINIVVDSKYRRLGIGSKLLDYIKSLYDDVTSIMLEVNEKNTAAIELYKKNEFKEINRRLKYYGEDTAIIMKRDV